MTSRKLNWLPDLPDIRDIRYRPMHINEYGMPALVPPMVDNRPKFSPVKDQGNLGDCVGNSLGGGACEFLENTINDLEGKSGTFADLSRLFPYYLAREKEGTINQDSGCRIRDAIKAIASVGICSEALWPYDITRFAVRPSAAAYADASTRKISLYMRCLSLSDLKSALAEGAPVVFGLTVYQSFMGKTVDQTGVVPMPMRGERPLGGHALCAAGYDDDKQHIIFRNSWGAGWGDGGYGYLPYSYPISDTWCVTR